MNFVFKVAETEYLNIDEDENAFDNVILNLNFKMCVGVAARLYCLTHLQTDSYTQFGDKCSHNFILC